MRHEDQEAFAALLSQCLAFYGQTVSPFALDVWWQACEGCDLEQVRRALTAHAMDPESGRWPPKPADIVRVLAGTHGDRALIAFGKTLDAIRRVGAYQSVVFDDGIIHAVVEDMGGWPKLCRTKTDDLPFSQKRFCDAYRAYSRSGSVRHPPTLAGEHEAANALHGHRGAPPVLIGDAAKARRVQLAGVAGGKSAVTVQAALPSAGEIAQGTQQ
jgi:hypothetical protein